jgi:hypothetical protein
MRPTINPPSFAYAEKKLDSVFFFCLRRKIPVEIISNSESFFDPDISSNAVCRKKKFGKFWTEGTNLDVFAEI